MWVWIRNEGLWFGGREGRETERERESAKETVVQERSAIHIVRRTLKGGERIPSVRFFFWFTSPSRGFLFPRSLVSSLSLSLEVFLKPETRKTVTSRCFASRDREREREFVVAIHPRVEEHHIPARLGSGPGQKFKTRYISHGSLATSPFLSLSLILFTRIHFLSLAFIQTWIVISRMKEDLMKERERERKRRE